MENMAEPTNQLKRRTLVKGAAWALPVVAVAASVPTAAASGDPVEPVISVDWGEACATTGAGGGCANLPKALQAPLTVTNGTPDDLILVITDARASTDGVLPSTANTPGIASVWTDNGAEINCAPELGGCSTCEIETANPNARICTAAGAALPLWMVFNSLGDASSFVGQVTFQWYKQSDCSLYGDPVVVSTPGAISSGNCAK